MLMPGKPVPALSLDTVGHGRFDLASETSERGTLVVVYRGWHCPICATYLTDLGTKLGAFAERGYGVIAVSTDGAERAGQMAEKTGAPDLRIGYGLSLETARDWGLYLSQSIGTTSTGVEEPHIFAEPGLFVVRPDGTLYLANVQTVPFARPSFEQLLGSLDFVAKKDYPPRGTYELAA